MNSFKNKRGQAMIVSVVFFLFISMSLILGISGSSLREFRIVEDTVKSKQGFFTAESGSEDYTYRLKTGKQTYPSETISLNGATTTITLTDIGAGQKEIISVGDIDSFIRKIRTVLTFTTGASFNYGVQVGSGGLTMGNNSGIYGNVYSNGNITGSGNAFITGTAIAANSSSIIANQSNDTPSIPPSNITFGDSASTQDFAQSFTVSTTSPINKIEIYIKRTATPPANLTVRIVPDNNGVPDVSTITSASLAASLVTTSYGWVTVSFTSNPDMIESTTYWIVLDGTTGSATKNYTIGGNSTFSGEKAMSGGYGGSWNNTSPSGLSGYFRVYLGGIISTIDGVRIGQNGTGNAWAHTVKNSTISGNNYCQVGSGNNKICDTSQPDPTPQDFPISEGNISAWKDDAIAGGTINGNYTLDGSSGFLGPKHITGNLVVKNGAILTMTGAIWVGGNATFSNNSLVKLSPTFGGLSSMMIVDGKVIISNNGNFTGSGQIGSYILLLSTSRCPNDVGCDGADAIDVSNNAGTVILNAIYGTLHLNNNAGAKEATAREVKLDNGATITYESGLANINFSSGPGGAFNINTWREVK